MAFSETGHYKNVANFNLLTEYVVAYGPLYDPARSAIKITHLHASYTAGNDLIQNVQASKNNYSLRVDEREIPFEKLPKFCTRLMGILSGTNLTPQMIADAKSINVKIQIAKTKKPKTTNLDTLDPTGTEHSTSRLSYDSRYENFNDMVNLLTSLPEYNPNDLEFLPAALSAYAQELLTATNNINTAVVQVANSRIERNLFLYTPETGLVDTALQVKQYVKGLFGASSPQFRQINSVKFKNL